MIISKFHLIYTYISTDIYIGIYILSSVSGNPDFSSSLSLLCWACRFPFFSSFFLYIYLSTWVLIYPHPSTTPPYETTTYPSPKPHFHYSFLFYTPKPSQTRSLVRKITVDTAFILNTAGGLILLLLTSIEQAKTKSKRARARARRGRLGYLQC